MWRDSVWKGRTRPQTLYLLGWGAGPVQVPGKPLDQGVQAAKPWR